MKKLLLLTTSLLMLMSACKKDSAKDTIANDSVPSKVITIGGQQYPVIKIGSKTWTAINYNGTGGLNYDNSTTNMSDYGKLYTLDEAKAVVLPAGWRLPTQEDFNALMSAAGTTARDADGDLFVDANASNKLRAITSWTRTVGNNALGFNAVAAGDYFQSSSPSIPSFTDRGTHTYFWSSTAGPNIVNGATTEKTQYSFVIVNVKFLSLSNAIDLASVYTESDLVRLRHSIRFVRDN
jgi:uncharacterized protein (TIGR02145 family)